jgi:hypothetical protein
MNFGSELEQKSYIVSKRLLCLGPFPARRHLRSAGDGVPLIVPFRGYVPLPARSTVRWYQRDLPINY